MTSKRIGKHWFAYGRTDGFALGINISKYFIIVDLVFWYVSIEF